MTDSPRLLDLTIADFARQLASGDPTPGGGSAAALSAALGAALVSMVANLTAGRPASAAIEEDLREIALGSSTMLCDLLGLVEVDAAAYDSVVRARRLRRDDDRAAQLRAAAMREAVAGATLIPLRMARRAAEVLGLAERLAPIGNRHALSDVAVAADLALAGMRGGLANVRANLPSLPADDALHAEIAPQIAEIDALIARGARAVEASLATRAPRPPGSATPVAANEPTA